MRKIAKLSVLVLGSALALGCGSSAPGVATDPGEAIAPATAPGKGDGANRRGQSCDLVRCFALPECGPDQQLLFNPSNCCGRCVGPDRTPPVGPGDCACYGGWLNASDCRTFGSPWTWVGRYGACEWRASDQGGLTAEQCQYVQNKHSGDGSGSDIYNLGLACVYGY